MATWPTCPRCSTSPRVTASACSWTRRTRCCAAAAAVLDVMQAEPWRHEQLWENARYFRTQLHELGIDTGSSTSYVVPIMVGEERALLYEVGLALRARGLFVT